MTLGHTVTQLLHQAAKGDPEAVNKLYPLVEADMRAIARRLTRPSIPEGDLDTTVMVDKAYLRLVGEDQVDPGDLALVA